MAVREEPLPDEDRIEIVGSVDAGITAAKWSPDEELLAITTTVQTVVFMSRNFEGVLDLTMTSEDLNMSNHVSVGWGRKETQFQGKGAKALRDPTIPEVVDKGTLSPRDDFETTISWRGDGAYLAISNIVEGIRRIIRVYSRDGVLDSVSEPVDGLEGALSWRPAGNLITGIQRREDNVNVVFFERNGLRHGQFSLRLTTEQVNKASQHISLSWNSDSTVLAVIMDDSIQLWTMGNYHWYLKQEIPKENSLLASANPLIWHPETPLRFLTAATGRLSSEDKLDGSLIIAVGSIISIEYIFTTARGPIAPPDDHGIIAVIDGRNLKITPFQIANIPPPMGLHDIAVETNITDVAFNADGSRIAVLHQREISIFDWKDCTVATHAPILATKITLGHDRTIRDSFQQLVFADMDDILVLQHLRLTQESRRYGRDQVTGRMEEKTTEQSPSFAIFGLSSFSEGGTVHPFVHGLAGGLHSLRSQHSTTLNCQIPPSLPWVEILALPNGHLAFGLSVHGYLYANSQLVSKNCTSFLVTPAHLIFTTTTHFLKFIHLTGAKGRLPFEFRYANAETCQELDIPADDPEQDERCRSIERGARLVTAIPSSLCIILQMPRGNLETIFPRAMVLAGIRRLIEQKNYKLAFKHCRTQRVDMNLLYDHAPEQFLSNVAMFVNQVNRVSYIDLFLSSLRYAISC